MEKASKNGTELQSHSKDLVETSIPPLKRQRIHHAEEAHHDQNTFSTQETTEHASPTPASELSSTTLLAIEKLALLSDNPTKPPSIVLSHLLYTMPNRKDIDRDLDNLRADGRILLIQLREWNVQGKDPTGIVLFHEWEEALRQQLKLFVEKRAPFPAGNEFTARYMQQKAQESRKKYNATLNKFLQFVKLNTTENYILLSELSGSDAIGADDDDSVMLTRIGAIGHRDEESHYLNCPHMGWFLVELRKGRREMLLMLKNAKFKELTRERLLRRKLKRTSLHMELLVRDCTALNYIKERELPDGSEILTITKHGLKYLEHNVDK
eukprot:CAMPEP_0117438634 /NCGR_PEP_ID=MMETSP0759-20121206/2154_1 /TAXON_ID=63605 /ORGANISM="Percolomonas cosmopolitus, Strain WS" /LENGTH=323 /DNA_ID=CAMNT_0005230331 /DNA_START=152 /DNA_END=1123 /DNA_ORIENTATION=+